MGPDPTSAPHRGPDGGLPIDLPIFLGRRRALGLLGGDPAHGSNDANVLDGDDGAADQLGAVLVAPGGRTRFSCPGMH